jgi:hypothetical protein
MTEPGSEVDVVAVLQRWAAAGGIWRVADRSSTAARLELCRCDGGEVAEVVTTTDPDVLHYLDAQTEGVETDHP